MSWQVPGSHITCTLGVGCNETGVCYAEAHGQPEQCGVTIMDGIDLTQIKPLTEAEAEEYFNRPTPKEKYDEAIVFLEQTYEYHAEDIKRYVAYLKMRIRTAEDSLHAAEQSCLRHHQMGQ